MLSNFFSETIGGMHEKRLLDHLLMKYNYLERPVINESEALLLTFGITLQQIIDVVSPDPNRTAAKLLTHGPVLSSTFWREKNLTFESSR